MKDIVKYITGQIAKAAQEKHEPQSSKHIFYRLLASIDNKISFEQKTKLLWVFTNVEKALLEARRGNKTYSKFYFDQIKQLGTSNGSFLSEVYNFMMLPATAFYEYTCTRQFEHSIELLCDSISSIKYIVSRGYSFMQSASVEQYLNIGRVLYKQNKKEEAIQEFGKLILYILTGRANTSYTELEGKAAFDLWSEQDRIGMLQYVTDVALFKYFEYKVSDTSSELLELLFHKSVEVGQKSSIEYISIYQCMIDFIINSSKSPKAELLDSLESVPLKLNLMPRTLQFLFLTQFETLFNHSFQQDETLTADIRNYCTEKLNLGHLFSNKPQQNSYLLSPLRVTSEGSLIA